tara:strand:+ start:204 stop:401 length:198 start_codon:yes stop_codon:yes gene_type:complete
MAIDPEVIQSSSKAGRSAKKVVPRWTFYLLLIGLFLVMINLIKALIPWIILIIVVAFILKRADIR